MHCTNPAFKYNPPPHTHTPTHLHTNVYLLGQSHGHCASKVVLICLLKIHNCKLCEAPFSKQNCGGEYGKLYLCICVCEYCFIHAVIQGKVDLIIENKTVLVLLF